MKKTKIQYENFEEGNIVIITCYLKRVYGYVLRKYVIDMGSGPEKMYEVLNLSREYLKSQVKWSCVHPANMKLVCK